MDARARHYGMDWLRIGAFALLIVYHVGMVFAPWDWVVKAREPWPALIVPMALTSAWRLPLLFAVSGYAARKLFEKAGDPGSFLRQRSLRLLPPVGFALIALLPPELWVRALQRGYEGGFARFWLHDYWLQPGFPQWEHLWFVVYLWGYTLILAGAIAALGLRRIDAAVARWLTARRIVWAPIAALIAAKWALIFVVPEKQGLLTDWAGHAEYAPMLLFGFVLAARERLWPAVLGCWRPAAVVAAVAGTVVLWFELTYQGHNYAGHLAMLVGRAARLAMAWAMVLLGFNAAEQWWNRDHRWRATLAEAVFPLYLIHQGAIVLIAWFTLGWGLPDGLEFLLILGGTSAVAAAFYLLGRRIRWLRPLIGLAPVRSTARPQPLPAL